MNNQLLVSLPMQDATTPSLAIPNYGALDNYAPLKTLPMVVLPDDETTVDPEKIVAPILELPKMILVETRFITQQTAVQAALEMPYTLDAINFEANRAPETVPPPQTPVVAEIMPQPFTSVVPEIMPPGLTTAVEITPIISAVNYKIYSPPTRMEIKLVDAAVNTELTSTEVATITDAPPPVRSRSLQTESPLKNSIATQCNLEIEHDFGDDFRCEEIVSAVSNSKQEFLKYVAEKTKNFSSGKRECLLCGEIKANEKTMQSHMAIHWGPSVLCFRCGIHFEHKILLQQHKCASKMKPLKKGKTRKWFKCPHFRCCVTAISLQELYDHINEHTSEYCYRCTGCGASFKTAGELRHHLPIRLKCLESAKRQHFPYRRWQTNAEGIYRVRVYSVQSVKRKRIVVKSFLSQRAQSLSRRCQICQQYCSNSFKFHQHSKRCLKTYQARLRRKRYTSTDLRNGNEPPVFIDLSN